MWRTRLALKILFIVITAAIMVCLIPSPVAATAGEEKAVLTAKELTYDYERKLAMAKGEAILKHKDIILRGEVFLIDTKKNTIRSEDYVTMEKGQDVISGYGFFYDFEQEQGTLGDYSRLDRSETGEPMILHGERVEIDGDTLICTDSTFTSCDRENPHFHLTAEKIEYFPGDRIVFHKVKYYEGKFHLFSVPRWVVSLKEERNNFDETTFGYNKSEGWYLKVVYRYFLNSSFNGKLLLDLIERRGSGEGVLNYFPVGEGKEFSASVYHFENYLTGGHDYQFGAGWYHEVDNLYSYSLQGEYWLNSGVFFDEEKYRLTAKATGKDRTWPFTANLETGGSDYEFYFKPKLNVSWQPTTQTRLTYNGRLDYKEQYSEYSAPYINMKYRYDLLLNQSWPVDGGGSFRFQAEIHEAQDLSPEPTPYWRDWNRLPYLSLDTPYFNLDLLGDYQVKIDYLHLVEVPARTDGHRAEIIMARRPQPIWEYGTFTLNLIGSLRKQNYWLDEGEFTRRAASVGLEGVENFTPHLTWKNSLNWVESGGSAPSTFSYLVSNSSYYLPNANWRSGIYYQSGGFKANIEGGCNLSMDYNPWYQVTATANLEVSPENRMDFATSYNPNTGEWGDLKLIVRYEPDKYNLLRLDLFYNPRENSWSTLDLEAKLRSYILHNLQSDVNVKYSFFGEGLERARLGLVYDWHCREVYVGYDFMREEYSLQLQYKVFPEAGFGFGSSDTGFSMNL